MILSPPLPCRHWIVFLECWFWHASLFQVSQPHRLKVALITVISQLLACTWKNPYRMRDSQPKHDHCKLYFGYLISPSVGRWVQICTFHTFQLTSSEISSCECRIISSQNRIFWVKERWMTWWSHGAQCCQVWLFPAKVAILESWGQDKSGGYWPPLLWLYLEPCGYSHKFGLFVASNAVFLLDFHPLVDL